MQATLTAPTKSSLILRGLANILLGAVAFLWPGVTLYVLVILFALNILLVGVGELTRPFVDKKHGHTALTVMLGLAGIVLGIYLLARPVLTVNIMGLIIAFWALVFGLIDIVQGFSDSKAHATARILFVLLGILSITFGGYLLFYPVESLVILVWILGFYALVTGILYVIGSFFLKDPKGKK